MSDAPIFLVGLLVFLLVTGGLAVTVREFAKMGNEDQNDSHPRSVPSRWKR